MHNNDCQQFQFRIDLVLDQRKSPNRDPFLSKHAEACADCRQLLTDYQFLDSAIVLPVMNANMRLNDSVSRTPAVRIESNHFKSMALMIASLAAILFVSITLAIGNFDASSTAEPMALHVSPQPNERVELNQRAVKSTPSQMVRRNYLGESISMIGSKISEGQFNIARNSIKPIYLEASINELSEKLHPLNAYYQYSVELPGVRPISTSLNATFDLIQKTISESNAPESTEQPDLGQNLLFRRTLV